MVLLQLLFPKSNMQKYLSKHFSSKATLILFILLLVVQIFTRFSYPDTKSDFSWDQIDNAWAAKNIIYDHKLPLVGMQAKGNTGFYIGPYYYYLITPFYFATNLDPSASIAIAGVTSILMFFLTYFLIKDIFNEKVALLATFFEVFSVYIIILDRIQWPVNFIAPISLTIFYGLYKIMSGNTRYFLLLAFAFGLSLHVHFTSVFYIPLIILCIPFFPRTKQTVKNIFLSIPVILFFLFPIAIAALGRSSSNIVSYIGSSYLGIHLRRFFQIAGDGFIEFQGITNMQFAKHISYILFPLYLFLLYSTFKKNKGIYLVYLSILWVLLPWLFFATYRGELSNYYFSITRPIVLMMLSYILYRIVKFKKTFGYIIVALILVTFIYINTTQFFAFKGRGLGYYRKNVDEKIKKGQVIEFSQGNPESYLYFINKQRYDKK